MHHLWGVRYSDGSQDHRFTGPLSRSYNEAQAAVVGGHLIVRVMRGKTPMSDWMYAVPRRRFEVEVVEGPWDSPRIYIRCVLCGHLTRGYGWNVCPPVKAFEAHWAEKHPQEG